LHCLVECILDAQTLHLLGGRGGVPNTVWDALVGRSIAELIAAEDAALLAEIGRTGVSTQMSLDLTLAANVLPLLVEVVPMSPFVVVRGQPRQSKELTNQQLTENRLAELGILVSGIAHDFNNVLSAILGNAEYVADAVAALEGATADVSAALVDIATAAERSRELIAQMLGYAAQRGSPEATELDLRAITSEMTRLLRASIPPRVSLELALRGNLQPVKGDASQLRQVIMNLIVNAADSIIGEGTINVSVGMMYADPLLLAAGYVAPPPPEGDYVFVAVEDTGSGITPTTLARIFDPFFTTKRHGRGLGLAGVRSIIGAHGGTVLVSSTPGLGTSFRMLLPVNSAAPRKADEGSSGLIALTLHGLRVLVIDDEAMVLRVSERVLTSRGAEVTIAADGHQGIEMFAAAADQTDCVVLNVAMPFIDGIEVAHELRALRDDVPILFVSGYERDAVEPRIAGLHHVAFLEKPFTSGAIVMRLHALLDGTKSAPR
jgi:two-component system cell cycle sensor histidine kinase/response regulator CckA